jgi:hypothetical protein
MCPSCAQSLSRLHHLGTHYTEFKTNAPVGLSVRRRRVPRARMVMVRIDACISAIKKSYIGRLY